VNRHALVSLRPLLLALATSLVTSCAPRVPCRGNGDATCGKVNGALAMVRNNIGGWCGTPNASAERILAELGPDAIPYLAAAFDDVDDVAELAMRITVQHGCPQLVAAWCNDNPFQGDICRRVLHERTQVPPGETCALR
jgi:hypothetical protein